MHEPRLDYWKHAPEATAALLEVTRAPRESGLEPALIHLVALRASQINGCAYCVDLHYRDALDAGVAPRRVGRVNGEPALLRHAEGRLMSVSTFVVRGGRIYVVTVLNPDKLGRVAGDGEAAIPP